MMEGKDVQNSLQQVKKVGKNKGLACFLSWDPRSKLKSSQHFQMKPFQHQKWFNSHNWQRSLGDAVTTGC